MKSKAAGKKNRKASESKIHVSSAAASAPRFPEWLTWKRFSVGSLVAVLGLTFTWLHTGEDSLRADIYQPLYEEVQKNESAVLGNTPAVQMSTDTLNSLRHNGGLERIPKNLRNEIEDTYNDGLEEQTHIPALVNRLESLVPAHVRQLRTEQGERQWIEATVAEMNKNFSPGLTPYMKYGFSHAGYSPALDIHDPQHPHIMSPGALTWQINDWLDYPSSVNPVDKLWNDDEFLEFHDRYGVWYLRITRADLRDKGLTLHQFLDPIYAQLSTDPDFKQLAATREKAKLETRQLKRQLADRIASPKRITDLFRF